MKSTISKQLKLLNKVNLQTIDIGWHKINLKPEIIDKILDANGKIQEAKKILIEIELKSLNNNGKHTLQGGG